jgi:hemerythrin
VCRGPKSSQNFKSGSVVLQEQHKVLYSLLNEVYIVVVAGKDEDYEAVHVLNRVKRYEWCFLCVLCIFLRICVIVA